MGMRMSNILAVLFGTLVLSSLACSQVINRGVPDSFQVGYATRLNAGDSSLTLSNSGASDQSLCVNIYVFDTSEELNECCACPVTPDGYRVFSGQADLTSNPLTGIHPATIAILLVGTSDGGICDPAAVTGAQLAPGVLAWGTTLDPASSSAKTYDTVPVTYLDAPLVAGELAALDSTCGFLLRLGSGQGICKCGQSGD